MNKPRINTPLRSLDDALATLVAVARGAVIVERETVRTFDALGRVLAEAVISTLDVPPADNSAMDGYAVRVADVSAPATVLPVSQRIPAGVVGQVLQPGTAARIFTGAQVPAGADAVVMQEECDAVDDGRAVRVNRVPVPGLAIRRRGEDVARDAVVLTPGIRLSPQALGMAASVGVASLAVVRRPRVALFSTGDELAMPGEPLKPGAIYNSNRFTLRGLLMAAGCEVTDLGIVPDRLDATRAALRQASAGHDLILTCGGVSVGEEDHLRPAVEAEGRLELWQMAIKPGKPLAFGAVRRSGGGEGEGVGVGDHTAGETLFIGLPGNPVSSFVTFVVAVTPVLRALQGIDGLPLPAGLSLRADFAWPRPDRRREFLRVRVNSAGGLDLFANQGSGVLTSLVWADGLVDNPPGQAIAPGDQVRFLPMSDLVAG